MNRWLVIILLTLSTACGPEYSGKESPPIVDGTIDLSGWDFTRDGPVRLDGDWLFAAERLVDPAPWSDLSKHLDAQALVPGGWSSPDGTSKVEYASYGLRVVGLKSRTLGLRGFTPTVASRLTFIDLADGRVLRTKSSGVPSDALDGEIPVGGNKRMFTSLPVADDIAVLIQVSSFSYRGGGIWRSVVLDTLERSEAAHVGELIRESLMAGVLLIIGLYHIVIFFLRRRDKSALFFAFFCFFLLQRVFSMGIAQNLELGVSEVGYVWLVRLEYTTLPLLCVALPLFLYSLVQGRLFLQCIRGLGLVSFGLFVFTLLTTPLTFTAYLWLYQLLMVAGVLVTCVHLGSVAVMGHRLARLLLVACGFVGLGVLNDVLHANEAIQTTYITPFLSVAFILLQAGILASRSADAHARAERLGENLQEEVRNQTIELQEQTQSALRLKAHAETARISAENAQREAEQLREQAELDATKLRELDQQKTAFFQNMSHELRTPLTLILGPLEDESKTQPTNENLSVSTKNARRLLRLVNQLLDFQKLEAGKKDLNLAPLNLNRFTHVLGDYFASACSSKAIAFNVTRDGRELVRDEVVAIQSEPDALEKVAFNFLSNALKYTPRGGTIELGLVSQPEHRVRLFVKDSGPGISREGQTKLFQVFSQVEESTTREYEGTGLGLALVKSLVEEMGGTVGVESAPGKGSTFYAEFTVVESMAQKPLRSLLIVEDDEATLRSYSRMLQKLELNDGFDQAVDYPSAMTLLKANRYKLVVSDGNIPGGDGAELLKKVREESPDTKLVLLTGEDDQTRFNAALSEAKIDQILLKPIGLKDLRSCVSHLVESYSGAADESGDFQARAWLLADGGETGVETEVEEEGDIALESEGKGQLILVVDDLEDMRNLIGRALKKRGYRVLKAANGEQGYEVICERRPDLVISDWMMPKLSGPDMLKQVRANNDISTTPFILLTAKSDEESKLIETEIGADVFLGKPFNDQELGSAVRNLLGLKSREKEVQKLNDYITESVLKRYLPPALIGDILSGELSMDKPAELRDITVLFSDLKGFTKTSEDLGPEGISAFLNEYLTVMNEVIFEHGGTIDKFIGDAIMVLFGAPNDMSPEEQVKRATHCARAMQDRMRTLAHDWRHDGAGHLQMRIGIHHGSAVVGNFGSTQRSDYTAIGPCVNMAARIESASEPGEVFISEATAKLMAEGDTSEVGAFELKGIEGKATLYRLV